MKIYIRSNSEQVVHLTDLFDEIISIVYADHIEDFRYSTITASEEEDIDYIDYMDYSDNELIKLPSEELKLIDDLDVLDRIRKLDKSLLTQQQINILRDEYRTKVIIDKSDVKEILNRLKKCDSFYRVRRDKNVAFEVKHGLKMQDYLDIIHELDLSDYVNCTKSIDRKYLGNDIIVFMPKGDFVLCNGKTINNFCIYIKIDLTDTDDVIAVISFHDTNKEDYKPYKDKIE